VRPNHFHRLRWRRSCRDGGSALRFETLERREAPGVLLASLPLDYVLGEPLDDSAEIFATGANAADSAEPRRPRLAARLDARESTAAPRQQMYVAPRDATSHGASAARVDIDRPVLRDASSPLRSAMWDQWNSLGVQLSRSSFQHSDAAVGAAVDEILKHGGMPNHQAVSSDSPNTPAPAARQSSRGGSGPDESGPAPTPAGASLSAAMSTGSSGATADPNVVMAAAIATGMAASAAPAVKAGCGCGSGSQNAAKAEATALTSGLALVDAAGVPLTISLDENTVVIGAATWCSACAQFKSQLAAPGVAQQLAGLRIVFAFGDEGGSGPGGVLNTNWLKDLPGDLAFLAGTSVRPDRFPSAYNPETGQFDQHPADAINAWLARDAAPSIAPPKAPSASPPTCAPPTSAPTPSSAPNQDGQAKADCGCGSKSSGITNGSPAGESNDGGVGATDTGDGVGGATAASGDASDGGGGAAMLLGDYNRNGLVDAPDITIWRDTLGSITDFRADGNEDLIIDQLDYDVWNAHYGDFQAPSPFNILSPSNHLNADDFTVSWQPSENATSYQLVVSENADLSAPFYFETLVGTNRLLTDLGERTLYIGVIATNAAGTTAASNGPYQVVIDLIDLRQTIFVTSENFFLSEEETIPPIPKTFGSAFAADYHCTNLANQAGLLDDWDHTSLYFRALLTEDFTALEVRAVVGNAAFLNIAGQEVAIDRDQLYSGVLSAPILTETGQVVTGSNVPVWTGSTSTGDWSGLTCDNWTSPFASAATIGNLNGAGTQRLSDGTRACFLGARFYCLGTRQDQN